MKTVSEVMETEVTTLGRNDTLQLAQDIMALGRVRHFPVLENGEVDHPAHGIEIARGMNEDQVVVAMQVGAGPLVADEAMPRAEMDTTNNLEAHGRGILMGREWYPPAMFSETMKPKLLLRPTILDRYVLREVASPFLIGLVLFTFVLLIPHLADISDLLVGKSATWTIIGKLIFNILPSFLALTIPMAFLLAVLLGLGAAALVVLGGGCERVEAGRTQQRPGGDEHDRGTDREPVQACRGDGVGQDDDRDEGKVGQRIASSARLARIRTGTA